MATPITKVWGIGVKVAEVLAEYGYKCAEDLLAKGEEELALIPGFGPDRSRKVLGSARELVNAEAVKAGAKSDRENLETDLVKSKKKKTKKKKKKEEGKKIKKLKKDKSSKPKKKKKTVKKSKGKKKVSSKKKK